MVLKQELDTEDEHTLSGTFKEGWSRKDRKETHVDEGLSSVSRHHSKVHRPHTGKFSISRILNLDTNHVPTTSTTTIPVEPPTTQSYPDFTGKTKSLNKSSIS